MGLGQVLVNAVTGDVGTGAVLLMYFALGLQVKQPS
jgi:hypothetical protein